MGIQKLSFASSHLRTTALIDGQKKQSDQTDKILWYLIDARKQSGQASGDPPNAAFDLQEKP